jgi:hypothetical protein
LHSIKEPLVAKLAYWVTIEPGFSVYRVALSMLLQLSLGIELLLWQEEGPVLYTK